MAKIHITREEGKLKELWEAWVQARRRTHDAVVREGMSSEVFRKADAEEGEIVRQIRKIDGIGDMHWMAF